MFVNTMPRYEILSADAIAVLDRGWRRIVSEIGVQFAKPEAAGLSAKAGQQVDGDVVKLDPEFVLEQVHEEVGHGGHFLGAAHTMERFRDCFYRPMLSSTANFERRFKLGGKDTAARAGDIWRAKLETSEPPPLDDAIRAELDDFVARRRRELGD